MNNKYYVYNGLSSDCRLKEPAPEGKDDLAAMRLWDISAKLVGYNEED